MPGLDFHRLRSDIPMLCRVPRALPKAASRTTLDSPPTAPHPACQPSTEKRPPVLPAHPADHLRNPPVYHSGTSRNLLVAAKGRARAFRECPIGVAPPHAERHGGRSLQTFLRQNHLDLMRM